MTMDVLTVDSIHSSFEPHVLMQTFHDHIVRLDSVTPDEIPTGTDLAQNFHSPTSSYQSERNQPCKIL